MTGEMVELYTGKFETDFSRFCSFYNNLSEQQKEDVSKDIRRSLTTLPFDTRVKLHERVQFLIDKIKED